MITMPLEADTRVIIDKSLENLGWKFTGKDKNVYFEQPKTKEEQRKLNGKRPDYVLYSNENDLQPLIIIEAKKKGERIDTALEQGIHYAKQLGAPIVYATDGLFCKTYHTKFNKVPILNGEEVDEFLRETLALKYLNTWEVNTVSPKVQYDRKELIKIFDEANNILRGDGLRAGIERFGEFANILFLKLISESEDIKKLRGIKSDFDDVCHWNYIKNLKASSRIEHINKIVYEKLNDLYKTEIFTPLTIRDSSILKDIIDKLDPLTLTDVDSDVKGDAFEYFLKESTATKNDLGEYFTPRHIVKTMVRLVNPQIGEKVYDPFCGTGGFLIESFRHIYNTMPRNELTNEILREKTIYGNEITNTARITKMNMILAGDGHSNIHMMDSLANPVNGQYDVVLANMPYSQKTKYGSLYDLPTTNGDSICVQHCMKAISSTSENGRMALVVPEGFLFRKDLAKSRELILKNCNLQSIISLPQGVFLPYTGVKTNIIYATKLNQKLTPKEKKNYYWYFEVKGDGYTLDNHRRKLNAGSDLDIFQEYRKLNDDQKLEMLDIGFQIIPLEKVKDNSFIMVGSKYRESLNKINSIYPVKRLGEVANFENGFAFKTSQWSMNGYKIIRIQNLTGTNNKYNYVTYDKSLEKYIVKKDDLLISWSGTLGFYLWNDSDAYLNQHIFNVKPIKDKILKKFLYYLSHRIIEDMKNMVHGGTMKHITKEYLKNILIPVPPLNIQKQIVDELEGYKVIIEGAKSVVDNYKPVIPKTIDGEQKTLDEVVEFMPSKNEIKHLPGNSEVSFVPMSDINANNISFESNQTRLIKEVYKGFTYFQNNDVLLAKITPCFENGKSGVACNLKNGIGFGSTEYIVMRAKQNVVLPEWIYYSINSTDFITNGKCFMTGTAGQQRIDINYIKNYVIRVPSLKQQESIIAQIEAEKKLIEPSKKIIEIFAKKIEDKVNELYG